MDKPPDLLSNVSIQCGWPFVNVVRSVIDLTGVNKLECVFKVLLSVGIDLQLRVQSITD